jgi:phosphonate transport system substrate-binding protein
MKCLTLLRAALAAALLVTTPSLVQAQAKAPVKTVNFSILATESSTSLQSFWAPIIADMEKQTGYKIKPFYGSNYTALIEAMRFKQTDVGWFSNQSGLEAIRRSGGEVFVRTFDPSGRDGYRSLIIVPAKSNLTLEQVLKCDKSLDFGIGDAKSTSGTLAPMTYLFAPRGIKPAECFKTVRSANHQANLFAVARGVLDVATNNSTAVNLQKGRDPAINDAIRVIWTSPPLPEDPIVWRKDLDPQVKARLRKFFESYGQGTGPEAARQRAQLSKVSIGGFKPADNSHLLPVREMEATEIYLVAKEEGNAAKISAAQKVLAGIQAERKALAGRTPK